MFENESWAPIKEFPHYLISDWGRVRRETRTDARKITINERGFPVTLLSSASSPTRYLRQINVLVADTYLPPPIFDNETAVWHFDGDLSNCHVDNLKWETRSRVLEWNEMNRSKEPKMKTPPVLNNRTGEKYENAFECAMAEGELESKIVWRIERQALNMEDNNARYRYLFD